MPIFRDVSDAGLIAFAPNRDSLDTPPRQKEVATVFENVPSKTRVIEAKRGIQ